MAEVFDKWCMLYGMVCNAWRIFLIGLKIAESTSKKYISIGGTKWL